MPRQLKHFVNYGICDKLFVSLAIDKKKAIDENNLLRNKKGKHHRDEPFNNTGVNGAGFSLANADDFMGLAGSSRSLLRLSMSPDQ